MRELDLTSGPGDAADSGDAVVRWDGALAVEATGEGVQPWRLPAADRPLHHPALVAAARCPSGVRLRWRSDTRSVAVALEARELPGHEGYRLPVHLDLVVDGDLVVTRLAGHGPGRHEVCFDDLPPGPHDLELWLPPAPAVRVRAVAVDAVAHDEPPPPDRRPRWVVYGSSITQGSGLRPTRTWPALVARRRGWHLVNLGYTGQCHLDPLVARAIAGLDADHVTLELGINVHNFATLRERTFGPAVHGFVASVRDGHPTVPVTVLSPVVSPEREATARSVLVTPTWRREVEGDLSLAAMRGALRQVVDVRRSLGDAHLAYVDGLDLLGPADAGLLPDGLHPNAAGHRVMAERYVVAGDGAAAVA
ncbi:MAG TPA: GDSL-type esterase/lipase family protein [Acidimicrobiales bacterium]